MDARPIAVEGRCLCGTTRYRIDGLSSGVRYCHCLRCRKHSGAALVGYLMVDAGRLDWQSAGISLGEWDGGPWRRGFCRQCGSSMPAAAAGEEALRHVPAGNILEMPLPITVRHVHADDGPARREPDPLLGGCLCGGVRFAVSSLLAARNCHCSRCRLSRAAPFATNVFAAADRFEWLSGRDRLVHYRLPGAARFGTAFCADCGSLAPREFGDRLNIPAGSLDGRPDLPLAGHIFTGSKAPWFTIEDELPQWPERMTDRA